MSMLPKEYWDRERESHEFKCRRVSMVKGQHLTHEEIDRIFIMETKPVPEIEQQLNEAIQVRETAINEAKDLKADAILEREGAKGDRALLHRWAQNTPDYALAKTVKMLMSEFENSDRHLIFNVVLEHKDGKWSKPHLKVQEVKVE